MSEKNFKDTPEVLSSVQFETIIPAKEADLFMKKECLLSFPLESERGLCVFLKSNAVWVLPIYFCIPK